MIYIDLLIVLKKGEVIAVICCANGTDSSHLLIKGKDYSILDEDKISKNQDWLKPKVYVPHCHKSDEEIGDNF